MTTKRSRAELQGIPTSDSLFPPVGAGTYQLYARAGEVQEGRPYTIQRGPRAGEEAEGSPSAHIQFEITGEEGSPGVGQILFHDFRFRSERDVAFAKGAYAKLVGSSMDEAIEQMDDPITEDALVEMFVNAVTDGQTGAVVKHRKQRRYGELTGEMEPYITRWV